MRSPRPVVFTAVLALAAAGCGSQHTQEELAAAHLGSPSAPANGSATSPVAGAANGAVPGHAGSPASGPTGGVGTDTGPDVVTPGATEAAGAEAVTTASGCTPGPPIRIGSVGTQSGIVGGAIRDGVRGVQAWAKWINASGGVRGAVHCHQVEVIVADDGGDPARHRALVQELVEQRGVVAFVHNTAPLSGQASIAYLEEHRIPVIGEDGGAQWFYESPMFFPQATAADPLLYADLQVPATAAVPAGLTRLGSITCQEAQYCTNADREWNGDSARAVGFEPVYRARASLAQPAFTAECLNARNADVQTVIVVLDANGIERLARDCAAQGFRPTYTFAAGSVADRMKDDPNLDGSLITLQVAPWFLTELPAVAEYDQALASSGALGPNASSVIGWTSAKLFEAAARHLSASPTSADVLEGLWALQGETLGGLTYPLTFRRDAPAPAVSCGFLVTIESGQFTAPAGAEIICR